MRTCYNCLSNNDLLIHVTLFGITKKFCIACVKNHFWYFLRIDGYTRKLVNRPGTNVYLLGKDNGKKVSKYLIHKKERLFVSCRIPRWKQTVELD